MKKFITIFLIVLIVFLLIPGKYTSFDWVEDKSYPCPKFYYPPLGGCFSTCKGKEIVKGCIKKARDICYVGMSCEKICYGLAFGSCGVNPISAKINFIKDTIKP